MNKVFSKAEADVLKEIIREAEAYLNGQLSLATSADQRASVMASVFAAAGTVIAAGLMAAASTKQVHNLIPVFIGGGLAAALFIVAASCCVKATMPVGFLLPGSQPRMWIDDISTGATLEESLAQQAGNFQEKIDENRKVLVANASWFEWGARIGIAAPFIGFIFWLAAIVVWKLISC